jgi:hypothetical protein
MPHELTDAGPSPARMTWLLLGLVAVAAMMVRIIPVVLTDFPVNDGGLFLAMTRAIRDAGWGLPDTVAWNGADLPFTYPPLGFYLAGALEAIGADLFVVFRWLPLLAATLIVPAVFLLGRTLLRSDIGGLVAALAYALAPASYVWMVQGGGVTRSPGLLLAVLTAWQMVGLAREPDRRRAVVVGLLAGATALVHPGAAVFTAISGALIGLFEGRTRRSFLHAAAALGVAGLVVAPWAVVVISRHGLAALTDVPSNGPDPVLAAAALVAGRYTGVPFTDPLAILGFALAVRSVIRGQLLLPLWLAAGILVSYQYAMVPFGLLVGTLAVDLVASRREDAEPAAGGWARFVAPIGIGVLAACLVIEGVASAFTVANPGAPVHALSGERRDSMAWVAANLEPEAPVAVITNSVWNSDADSEWFPVLTGRRSVATVQGTELLGQAAFYERLATHRSLQACVAAASAACVRDWLATTPATYLYLPAGPLHGPRSPDDCCADLRAALLADPGFVLVGDQPGATIFRVPASATATRPNH